MAAEDDDFEAQLRQEALEKDRIEHTRIRTDSDGTQYEWDEEKQAWFPKIDADFIAQYQMSYGSNTNEASTAEPNKSAASTTAPSIPNTKESSSDNSQIPDGSDPNFYYWWYYYYGPYAASKQQQNETMASNDEQGETNDGQNEPNMSSNEPPGQQESEEDDAAASKQEHWGEIKTTKLEYLRETAISKQTKEGSMSQKTDDKTPESEANVETIEEKTHESDVKNTEKNNDDNQTTEIGDTTIQSDEKVENGDQTTQSGDQATQNIGQTTQSDQSSADYDWSAYYKASYEEFKKQGDSDKWAAYFKTYYDAHQQEDDAQEHDHYFSQYYGENYKPDVEAHEIEEAEAKKNKKRKGKKGKEKEVTPGVKREREPPKWFEVEDDKQTQMYISDMPNDITDDELNDLMSKCGMIMFDPHTKKPKLKLYRDKDGQPKGDGLCCFIKRESVDLAIQLVDGYNLRGKTLKCELAKFELKGEYDPKKKKRALSNHAKRKLKEKQEKLFAWLPDKPTGERKRFERVVILKNMFDPKEFETDPGEINELTKDLREECSKYGDVRKVTIYDRHKDGIASIMFREAEEADVAKEALNGRWFAGKQISAETWDGRTKYEVQETEEERNERLKKWQEYLESGGDDKKEKPKQPKSEINSESTNIENDSSAADSTQEKPSGKVNNAKVDIENTADDSIEKQQEGPQEAMETS
ncbi:unnamed protein product [Owenia fusiformis]|uniref:17S U2 SnRNP complex component HTATSF1 n=1 Tax=Owenia fusiformis TaxID=6347 RepID=A0A8J1XGQ9_OWEFU|nr:unnamed protein product [Owenia fusiformis]